MTFSLPVTTNCYAQRVQDLRFQLRQLQSQYRSGSTSEELEALVQLQIRQLHATLWALHAEVEQD